MSDEVKRLRRKGVSHEDLQLALGHQEAQRRVGAPVSRLGEIVGVDAPRPKGDKPVNLTARQLRGKEAGAQAALIARQLALTAKTVTAAADFRQAANLIDRNHDKLEQTEFDFMAGNVSIGHQYHDTIGMRLLQSGATIAQQNAAASVLWTLTRYIKFQSYEVDITPAQLAELKGIQRSSLSRTLALLEQVGAIKRSRVGRSDYISITPEGVYRGPIQGHSTTVRKYKLSVVEGGKAKVEDKQIEA